MADQPTDAVAGVDIDMDESLLPSLTQEQLLALVLRQRQEYGKLKELPEKLKLVMVKFKETKAHYTTRIEELEAQLQQKQQDSDPDRKDSRTAAAAEQLQLQVQIKSLTEERDRLHALRETQEAHYKAELERLKSTAAKQEVEYKSKVQAFLVRVKKELVGWKDRAESLEPRLKEAEDKAQIAVELLRISEEKCAQIESQLTEAQQRAELAESKFRATSEQVGSAGSMLLEAEQKVALAEQELAAAKQRALLAEQRLETEMNRLQMAEQQAFEAQQRIASAQQQLAEKDRTIQALEQELQVLKQSEKQLQEEVDALQSKVAEWKARADTVDNPLQQDVAVMTSSSQPAQDQSAEESQRLNAAVATLEAQLQAATEAEAKARAEVSRLTEALAEVTSRLEQSNELTDTIQRQADEIDRLKAELENNLVQLNAKNVQCREFEAHLRRQEAQIAEMTSKQGLSESKGLRLCQTILDLFGSLQAVSPRSSEGNDIWSLAEQYLGAASDELNELRRLVEKQRVQLAEMSQTEDAYQAAANKLTTLTERIANLDLEKDKLSHALNLEKKKVTRYEAMVTEMKECILPLVRALVPLHTTLLNALEVSDEVCFIQSQLREQAARVLGAGSSKEGQSSGNDAHEVDEEIVAIRTQSEALWNELTDVIKRLVCVVNQASTHLELAHVSLDDVDSVLVQDVEGKAAEVGIAILEHESTLPNDECIAAAESAGDEPDPITQLEFHRRKALTAPHVLTKLGDISITALQCAERLPTKLARVMKLAKFSQQVGTKLAEQLQKHRAHAAEMVEREQKAQELIDQLSAKLRDQTDKLVAKQHELDDLRAQVNVREKRLAHEQESKHSALDALCKDLEARLAAAELELQETRSRLATTTSTASECWPTLGTLLATTSESLADLGSPKQLLTTLLTPVGRRQRMGEDESASDHLPEVDDADYLSDLMVRMAPVQSSQPIAKLALGKSQFILLRFNLQDVVSRLRADSAQPPTENALGSNQASAIQFIFDAHTARANGYMPDVDGDEPRVTDSVQVASQSDKPDYQGSLVKIRDPFEALGVPASSVSYAWVTVGTWMSRINTSASSHQDISVSLENLPDFSARLSAEVASGIVQAWKEAGAAHARRSAQLLQELTLAEEQIQTVRQEADSTAAQLGLARSQLRERLRAAQRESLKAATLQREVAELKSRLALLGQVDTPAHTPGSEQSLSPSSGISTLDMSQQGVQLNPESAEAAEHSLESRSQINKTLRQVSQISPNLDSTAAEGEELVQRLAETQQQVLTLQRLLENERQNAYSQGLAANRTLESVRTEAVQFITATRQRYNLLRRSVLRLVGALLSTAQVYRDRTTKSQRGWVELAKVSDEICTNLQEAFDLPQAPSGSALNGVKYEEPDGTLDELKSALESFKTNALLNSEFVIEAVAAGTAAPSAQAATLQLPDIEAQESHSIAESIASDRVSESVSAAEAKAPVLVSAEPTMEKREELTTADQYESADLATHILATLERGLQEAGREGAESKQSHTAATAKLSGRLEISPASSTGDAAAAATSDTDQLAKLNALVTELAAAVSRYRARCLELEAQVTSFEMAKTNESQQTVNLEYVKNIIIKYMANPDDHEQLFPVINTVLQLTHEEQREVASKRQAWLSQRSVFNPLKKWW